MPKIWEQNDTKYDMDGGSEEIGIKGRCSQRAYHPRRKFEERSSLNQLGER